MEIEIAQSDVPAAAWAENPPTEIEPETETEPTSTAPVRHSLWRRFRARLMRGLLGLDDAYGDDVQTPSLPIKAIFLRFWPYTKPYRGWIPIILFLLVLVPALDTLGLWMFKVLVDNVLVPHDFSIFGWLALAYIVITVLDRLVSFAQTYLLSWIGERILLTLRTQFFSRLHTLSLDFFAEHQLGDTMERLSDDVSAIEGFILSNLTTGISYIFTIIFYAAALFLLRWDLALVALVVGPLFLFLSSRFSKLIKKVSRETQRLGGEITAVAYESLSNAPLVHAYNRQGSESDRFYTSTYARFRAQMVSIRLEGIYSMLAENLELVAVLAVIAVGTWDLSRGLLTLGGLLAFLAFLSQLYGPVRGFSGLLNNAFAATASAERVIEYLDWPSAVEERPDAKVITQTRGRLTFENVTFAYPANWEHPIIDRVSFNVQHGETLALLGASGAGKSTIAKLLLRFYDPTEGRVRLDGKDLRDIELHSLREQMSVVMQETLIFDGTIRDNIAFGRPDATDDDIVRAAITADAHTFISALPDGYNTIVGERGVRVSGGQRQRIAIARAMVRDTPILVLDEPTTGLDSETAERILEPLQRLMRGRTTIIITHNLAAVRDATYVLVLEDGRVAERGKRGHLAAADGAIVRIARPLDLQVAHAPLETSIPIRDGRDRRSLRWPGSLLVPVA